MAHLAFLQPYLATLGVFAQNRKVHGVAMSSPRAHAPLHVIAGAGQIGPMVAHRLLARGLRVRMIRRGRFDTILDGVETVAADVSDPAAAAEVMRGASVVYHCANPRYHRWPAELLPLARGIVAGTAAAGARLVALDNLYMYGVPADGRLTEATPVAPRSKKGALRARAAEEMLAAHARGDAPVAIARAADFFGPGCATSMFGDRFWTRLLAGRAVEILGDPDQPRSYSYTEDVADGLVALGLAGDAAFGRVWHLPAPPPETTRAWVERFARAVGVVPRMTRLSRVVLRIAGVFLPEARELPEMLYQWNAPFILDDAQFRAAYGATHTPIDAAVAATVAWARAAHGGARAAA
jgi:nucleoside-diphosphate-sugar epimerase